MGSLYISACSNIVGHLNVDSKESGRVYRLGSGQTNIGDLVLGRTNERRGLTHLPQSYDSADEEASGQQKLSLGPQMSPYTAAWHTLVESWQVCGCAR